jgi:hypothetical protein
MDLAPPRQHHHQGLQIHDNLGGAEDDEAEVVLQDGFGSDPWSDMVGCERHFNGSLSILMAVRLYMKTKMSQLWDNKKNFYCEQGEHVEVE